MTVKLILSQKGSDVVTIEPGATVSDAIATLADRGIGSLLVTTKDGKLSGILSERDLIRALASDGAAALRKPISDIMTKSVVTCQSGDTVGFIMEQMTSHRFRHVPVVEQDRIAGVISIGDVVKYRLAEVQRETSALKDYIATA